MDKAYLRGMVKNLKDLMTKFKDEQACRDYLVKQRWNGVPECPHCGCQQSYRIENGRRFKCANRECWKKYSVTVGTIFEASNIPLSTWFPAIYFITAHKKGISSVQLGKNLGVTQKTAWFMLHRIRESLREKAPLLLDGTVQADECYVGGEEKNKHKNKRTEGASGRSQTKTPVVGLIETGGKVVTDVMKWVTKDNLDKLIKTHLSAEATLVTDTNTSYFKAGKAFDHILINHSEGEFAAGPYHTNSIENYWSVFKRTLHGTYHAVSPKHLQRYCEESAYRFNSRTFSDGFRWTLTFHQIEGRLKYKTLIANGKGGKEENGTPIQEIETGE